MPRKIKLRTESNIQELGIDLEVLKQLAHESIDTFFKDKTFHCGGTIPQGMLHSPDSVKTVMGTTSEACSNYEKDHIYPLLYMAKDQIIKTVPYKSRSVPFQVHYTLRLIQNLRDCGIPKCLQFGLILLYYKFCKGFKIPDPPEKILL
jgi:hypothetical protein